MSETFEKLGEHLKGQPENPLRPHQIKEYEVEKDRLSKIVHAGPYVAGDRGDAMKRLAQVNKALRDDVVKPVDPRRKDELAKTLKEAEGEIRDRLLPQNHMDKGPVGALGHFQRNEGSVDMVKDILTWKRAKLALDPENTDPDHLNVDYLRPATWAGQGSYRTDNLTKTVMGMTPAAKENWPLGEPTVDTPLKQSQRVHRPQTEAQKAGLLKARAARKAKLAAAAAEVTPDVGH